MREEDGMICSENACIEDESIDIVPPDTFKKTAWSAIPAVARSRIMRAIQCKVLSTDCIKDSLLLHE